MRSRAEIRQVLIDYDTTRAGSKIFGTGAGIQKQQPGDVYRDLGPDGSAVVLQVEMNSEPSIAASTAAASATDAAKKGGGKKKGGGGGKSKKK